MDWVIMMCQCKKYTTMVSDVDNGGGDPCIGTGSMWEISAPSSRFYYKPKIALKKSL